MSFKGPDFELGLTMCAERRKVPGVIRGEVPRARYRRKECAPEPYFVFAA
jgi:hypothetical protein